MTIILLTVIKACETAKKPAAVTKLALRIDLLATSFEDFQRPLILQSCEVDWLVIYPKILHRLDPAGCHGLDIWPFLSDMAILSGVVFADNQVGDVWCEVVFVNTTEFDGYIGYMRLRDISCQLHASQQQSVMLHRENRQRWWRGTKKLDKTHPLLRRDAGAADDDSLEGLGSIDRWIAMVR